MDDDASSIQLNQMKKFSSNSNGSVASPVPVSSTQSTTFVPQPTISQTQTSSTPVNTEVTTNSAQTIHNNQEKGLETTALPNQKSSNLANTNIVQNANSVSVDREKISQITPHVEHQNNSTPSSITNHPSISQNNHSIKQQAEAIDNTKEVMAKRKKDTGPGKTYMVFAIIATIILIIIGLFGIIFFTRSYNAQSGQSSQNLR